MKRALELGREVLTHTWAVLGEMAPWVLGGFAIAGVLSLWLNARVVREHFGGGRFGAILKAVVLGVPLPVCSCGVIPLGASLRKHGAGKGPTAAFLMSTPQTGVDSIAVTYGMLGGLFAIFRPLAALVSGVICGFAVEALAGDAPSTAGLQDPEIEADTSPWWVRDIPQRVHRAAELRGRSFDHRRAGLGGGDGAGARELHRGKDFEPAAADGVDAGLRHPGLHLLDRGGAVCPGPAGGGPLSGRGHGISDRRTGGERVHAARGRPIDGLADGGGLCGRADRLRDRLRPAGQALVPPGWMPEGIQSVDVHAHCQTGLAWRIHAQAALLLGVVAWAKWKPRQRP
jgi:hypothetical protein